MHTKNHPIAFAFAVTTVALSLTLSGPARAADPVVQAKETLKLFLEKDPGLRRFVESSAGYAIFPSVAKGAVGVGGARGSGAVFQRGGTPVAKVTLTQLTVGLQLGGQSYSEVIFFENPKVFNDFLTGEFSLAAQVSAVALAAGASKTASYQNGVAVFTATNSGLMFEASVGGQKFGIKPLK
jgi:lipid-binding SYLF domain-containing protein